jgi:Nucleotidyl transferase AbiEii toxin, Type IV TA system
MSTVSPVLLTTIKELQQLSGLSQFALAGGTNLAIRFGHRESQDIDLFCPEIVGIKHLEQIQKEVVDFYGEKNISSIDYPSGKESEQFTFLRFWVTKPCGTMIKVEVIQNMKMMDDPETIYGIRLVTTKDIGLFKLITGSSRAANKDIYDLDFITEHISLADLFEGLKAKKEKFNQKEHQSIFDLDDEGCPTQDPYLLLKFDGNVSQSKIKPMHSNDNILIPEGGKSWIETRTSWRMKVRRLFRHLGLEFKHK